MTSVLKATQSNSSCSFQINIWNLHPEGRPTANGSNQPFLPFVGKTRRWCKLSKLHRMKWAWTDLHLLGICHFVSLAAVVRKDLSNAGTETSIISAICFFSQEITSSEPIKCWEGNACSHRTMKNIIAERLFPFYQWNHSVSKSLTEALVDNNITTCSIHKYRGEQKHGGLQFSTTTKKSNCSCWTDAGLHISILAVFIAEYYMSKWHEVFE